MIKNRHWVNKERNKQVGIASGFYAMALVYGMICGDRFFGKKAALAIKDALLNQRSHVGEIFCIHKLHDEWNLHFSDHVLKHEYVASIVNLRASTDIIDILESDSFVILPIAPDGITPYFEVWYNSSSKLRCWEPLHGISISCKKIATSFLFNGQIPSSFDFDNYDYNRMPGTYIRNHLRNFFLSRYLAFYDRKAKETFSFHSCVSVNLSGHCLLIRKVPDASLLVDNDNGAIKPYQCK